MPSNLGELFCLTTDISRLTHEPSTCDEQRVAYAWRVFTQPKENFSSTVFE